MATVDISTELGKLVYGQKKDVAPIKEALAALQTGVNNIEASNIQTGAVSSTKIADKAVTTSKLADSSVDSIKLASNSVTTAKLLDGAVTNDKIGDTINTSKGGTGVTAYKDLVPELIKIKSGTITISGSGGTTIDDPGWGENYTKYYFMQGFKIKDLGQDKNALDWIPYIEAKIVGDEGYIHVHYDDADQEGHSYSGEIHYMIIGLRTG